jgi:effector-binding domain-containing protein
MHHDDVTAPELTETSATSTAVIRGTVALDEIASFFDRSFGELASVLGAQGVAPIGAAFARYAGPPGDPVELEVGFPIEGTVAPAGSVEPSSLPAGRVARLVHAGGYDELGRSWDRLGRWIVEQGLTPADDLWEVYVTEPSPEMDPADLRTELSWLVR